MARSRRCSTRPRPLGWSLAVVCVVALLALARSASTLPPQDEDRPSSTFRDVIDVSIVNLDVYVTDKKGRPITGLEREDFEIQEDYRPVEITNFVAIEGSSGGPGTSSAEPLNLVLYLDNLLLEPAHRSRVLGDIATFLGREFPAETQFLLATNDTKLDVVLPRTPDVGELLSALDNLDSDAIGIRNIADRRRATESIAATYEACDNTPLCDPCRDVWDQMAQYARAYAIETEIRMSRATGSLARFIAALGGLPGRKVLLYVSDGLQQRPGIDLFYSLGDFCPDRQREITSLYFEYDETTRLNRLAAHANANRVTFYPLDAAGVRGDRGTREDSARIANLQSSLFLLGNETGGLAILNAHRPLEALEAVAQDFSSYYSIAYRATDRRPAADHLIDVKVAGEGRGKRVRYRRTVRAKSVSERLAEQLMAALILGVKENPLEVRVTVEEPIPVAKKLFSVAVRIELPSAKLTRLDDGSSIEARLRLFLTARDERNRGTELREKTIELSKHELAPAENETAMLSYVISIDLPPGRFELALGVRDEIAQVASYLTHAVEVSGE